MDAINDIMDDHTSVHFSPSMTWALIAEEVEYVARTIQEAVEEDCRKQDGRECVACAVRDDED